VGGFIKEFYGDDGVLEKLLSCLDLPLVLQADAPLEYAFYLRFVFKDKSKALEALRQAEQLYDSQGHAYGSAIARLDIFKLDLSNCSQG